MVVIGQIKEAITIQPSGYTRIFSVRFHPWGFYALSGIYSRELNEQVEDATSIWGNELNSILEQMRLAPHAMKIKIVERFLIEFMQRQQKKVLTKTHDFSAILTHLQHHKGNIPVAQLAYSFNSSVRNFNRGVTDITGLSPKFLSRVIRLQHFLQIHNSTATLTDSLYKCGYYDQAHFIREFKEIAGMTPNNFFKEDHVMAKLMIQ